MSKRLGLLETQVMALEERNRTLEKMVKKGCAGCAGKMVDGDRDVDGEGKVVSIFTQFGIVLDVSSCANRPPRSTFGCNEFETLHLSQSLFTSRQLFTKQSLSEAQMRHY